MEDEDLGMLRETDAHEETRGGDVGCEAAQNIGGLVENIFEQQYFGQKIF